MITIAMLLSIVLTVACDRASNPTAPSSVAVNTGTSARTAVRAEATNGSEQASHGQPTAPGLPQDAGANEALRVNQMNKQALDALIAAIEPHVIYHPDGSWSVDSQAKLTTEAQAFVIKAQEASAGQTVEPTFGAPVGVRPLATTAGGTRSLTRYWWGYRIGMKSGDVSAVSTAWRQSGASAAIRTFLLYFGTSAWAVSVASVLVPAYALTIWYVDRAGGYRGVYLMVPWTVIPTVIVSQ